jgi:hypothetical protein
MPMGIVSDKDFNSELSKVKSDLKPEPEIKKEVEIIDVNRGRGNNPEVPNSLRNIIGETSITDGRQEGIKLAKSFGISPSSVSAYSVGATSTASYEERPNNSHLKEVRQKISKRARTKLMSALRHITEDKLEGAKAKDLAGIAKDMSAVIRTMEPDENKNPAMNNNGPTFVFYSPQFRTEESFDVVHAKE